jgi:L-fucose isomerase-like protein
MMRKKTTFALFFGNRDVFPSSLIEGAREELPAALKKMGHEVLMPPAKATRYGAVETTREGQVYAKFLREHQGEFGGVVLSLPNFGDETGAVEALRDAGVPILVQAYPDELDKMAPEVRRDAFCGKLSVMDVFQQYGVKFTALKPHVVSPSSQRFADNIDYFDRVCRVHSGMKGMVVGAIGARTTAFKTVRFDETTLQKHGITVETLDLADIFARVKSKSKDDEPLKAKAESLKRFTSWGDTPDKAFDNLTKLGVVLDEVVEEFQMDALAIRCWVEMQSELGISPCVLLGEMNNRGVPASCEVDVGNAIAMHALGLGSNETTACLDWNNNYGEEDDKCILFHCGPVPASMMAGNGRVTDHGILSSVLGPGHAYGCNVGRISPGDFTFSSLLTDTGKVRFYLGEGEFTGDTIPQEFFGCAGVARISRLQDVLLHIGKVGHRHHVSVTPGLHIEPIREALEDYLDCEVALPQES